MKIKDNFIVNYNEDSTITVYDLDENQYYTFNEIGTIIFLNIEKDINVIISMITNEYNLIETNAVIEIEEFYNSIISVFC